MRVDTSNDAGENCDKDDDAVEEKDVDDETVAVDVKYLSIHPHVPNKVPLLNMNE